MNQIKEAEKRVTATLIIRRNSDGETRRMLWEHDTDHYSWTDGNYGCNCNRSLFFAQAGDKEDAEEDECGSGGYHVRIERADGSVLFEDEGGGTVESENSQQSGLRIGDG